MRSLACALLCTFLLPQAVPADAPRAQSERRYSDMPWHLIDIWWDTGENNPFESLAVEITISEDVPSTVNLYISPVGLAHLSQTPFYGGIQTQADGYTIRDPDLRKIGPGFIFSMWGERSAEAIRPSAGGFFQSSGHEGDFVSVRRPQAWKKGKYTYRLARMDREEINGKPYTWVGAFVHVHETNEHFFIGALRFKGDNLILDRKIANFVEVYGERIPVSQIPKLSITFGQPMVNGKAPAKPTAEAVYPQDVPDFADAVAAGSTVAVAVGKEVQGRIKRSKLLIPSQ